MDSFGAGIYINVVFVSIIWFTNVYDVEHAECKEKLYFGEPAGNTFSSTRSDVADNKPSVHPQRA